MELNTMGDKKLRTYDEVNAEMQRLQVELDKARNEERKKQIAPWEGKVFIAKTGAGITYWEYIRKIKDDEKIDFVEAITYPDGSFKMSRDSDGHWYEVVAILDLYEVNEVDLEYFKSMLEKQVKYI